jgi:hypothetical protein
MHAPQPASAEAIDLPPPTETGAPGLVQYIRMYPTQVDVQAVWK